jgi:ribonuclease G
MSKEICISTTPHETRLAILENEELTEIYYERENEYTLAGSIYKGKVTRVLPGMQSAFVDLGLERDAFLYVTDFLEEQDEGADFERASSQPQPRREGVREPGRENGGREGGGRDNGRNRPALEAAAPVEIAADPEGDESAGEGDSPSGTKRWRGRRGRRTRGFRPRGPESDTRAPEVPEPAAVETFIQPVPEPSAEYRYEAPAQEYRASAPRSRAPQPGSPAPAAILLPGESLSRYGSMPEARVSLTFEELPPEPVSDFVPNFIPPKPSTLIETEIQWDGKSLLPGESRAGRAQPASGPVAPASIETAPAEAPQEAIVHQEPPLTEAGEIRVDSTNEPVAEAVHTVAVDEYQNGQEDADRIAVDAAQASAEEPAAFAVPTPSAPIAPVPDTGILEPVVSEPAGLETASSEPVAPVPTPFEETAHHDEPAAHVVTEPVALIHEQPAEAEVEPASAVDNSESHEPELIEETQEFEPETASASHRIDAAAPSEFRVSSVFEEETPAAGSHAGETHTEFHEAAAYEQPSPAAAQVEYDSEHVFETGHSDPVNESNHDAQATEVADQLFGFAPGAGILEEEVIDEEEYDFEPIHAHADDHEMEELEEETLEHSGSEIGDMVREAHLNQRLAVEPGSEDSEEESDDLVYGEVELDEEDEEGEESEHGENGSHAVADPSAGASREREGGHSSDRGPRRDGRRGDRGNRGGRPGQRRHGSGGGNGRRASAQLSDLPIISELLKQGQEILVQIAKEPIAKKGARITSHIALPGRFLVFMPTVNHVGVSRKIDSDEERHRLKRILISEKGDASGGFIVRTAADGASEEELRADLRFLISLWNDIKQREESSKAPALIYHDLNLIERVLRDQVSDNFSTIWVDSESEYERIVRFLNRFQPSLVRRVKLYTKETPLFEHFGIQDEISKALKSKVWLKSGGSIVINQTEALVAIDINTGKYVGKTARLEDTIVKTNLDAIPEIVRQIRLRDLGGIIVIDFIDMDERKNRHKVLAALEEALKADRAPSKVLQFNDFGLVAITRKRVKQSLERTLSIPCPVCAATGMVKSPVTVANEIYVELRKMQRHIERGDVMLRVNPEVVKTLKANNARWLTEMEEMIGKTIIVKSDPALHPEQFDIH